MFPDFSALQAKLEMFESFLVAAAKSLDFLHAKVDAVKTDVDAIKSTSLVNPVSIVDTTSALSDLAAQGASILDAVHSVKDSVHAIVSAAPAAPAA